MYFNGTGYARRSERQPSNHEEGGSAQLIDLFENRGSLRFNLLLSEKRFYGRDCQYKFYELVIYDS